MPKVSLIMPVYNGENLVTDAIESVLSQTFESFELIIINDGSTDGSEAVIQEYLPHDKIEYYTQENRGVTETTNRGIRLANGEYLGIHPQDDVSLSDRLEKQVGIMERHSDIGFVYAPARFVNLHGEVSGHWGAWRGEGKVPSEAIFYKLYVDGMFLASPSILFRRDHITDERHPWGDPDLQVVSDWEHWLVAAQHYGAFEMADPVVDMLRDEDHDNLSSRRETVLEEEKTVLRRIRERYASGNPPVTRQMFAKAMSNHFLRELRYQLHDRRDYPGTVRSTLKTFLYNPLNAGLYREFVMTLYRLA